MRQARGAQAEQLFSKRCSSFTAKESKVCVMFCVGSGFVLLRCSGGAKADDTNSSPSAHTLNLSSDSAIARKRRASVATAGASACF